MRTVVNIVDVLKLHLIGITGFLTLMACSLPPVVDIPAIPSVSSFGKEYGKEVVQNGECPDLTGHYHNAPEVFEVRDSEVTVTHGDTTDYYSLIPFHLADRRVHEYVETPAEHKHLAIDQPDDSIFVFTNFSDDGSKEFEKTFVQSEGDFFCKDGFLEFPQSGDYGVLEGMTVNGQMARRMRLTEEGDLVIIKSNGPHRSAKADVAVEFTHRFYIYPSKEH